MNGSDPAFYEKCGHGLEDCSCFKGLSKREYFAAMALLQEFADVRQCNPTLLAKLAVETADALIAELSK